MEEDAPSQPRAPALSRKLCEGSIRGHVACAGTRAWDAAVNCDRDEGAADALIAVMALGSMGSRPHSPALLRVGERSPSCTCQGTAATSPQWLRSARRRIARLNRVRAAAHWT